MNGQDDVWRRHALELNDTVIQSLTSVIGAFEAGETAQAVAQLNKTLASARRLLNDWMRLGDVQPGDLVRSIASNGADLAGSGGSGFAEVPPRVLIADDNADVRAMLRAQLEADGRFMVVGEASDGDDALDVARFVRPDVVLLDLAMPRKDGLQALPLLLEAVPGVKVIVLSGFEAQSVEPAVMAAGASAFIEKGFQMAVANVIASVLERPEPALAGHP